MKNVLLIFALIVTTTHVQAASKLRTFVTCQVVDRQKAATPYLALEFQPGGIDGTLPPLSSARETLIPGEEPWATNRRIWAVGKHFYLLTAEFFRTDYSAATELHLELYEQEAPAGPFKHLASAPKILARKGAKGALKAELKAEPGFRLQCQARVN